jgi:hypothetical protein
VNTQSFTNTAAYLQQQLSEIRQLIPLYSSRSITRVTHIQQECSPAMATTRIRKTFHYPDSSDDEDTVEAGLDAQGTFPLAQPPSIKTLSGLFASPHSANTAQTAPPSSPPYTRATQPQPVSTRTSSSSSPPRSSSSRCRNSSRYQASSRVCSHWQVWPRARIHCITSRYRRIARGHWTLVSNTVGRQGKKRGNEEWWAGTV